MRSLIPVKIQRHCHLALISLSLLLAGSDEEENNVSMEIKDEYDKKQ